MKFGGIVPLGVGNGNPEFLKALGPGLERRGFESLWIPEHVVLFDEHEKSTYPYTPDGKVPLPADSGVMDPFPALSFVAAGTSELRLGTGICIAAQRNPLYTARYVADLDLLSGGRAEFGVGLGWLREEYEALGVPWEGRGSRTDEYLDVMRSLWEDEVSSYDGDLYKLPPCRAYPKPVQKPHPPVHIGGDTDAALRRVARHGQGWFGMGHTPDVLGERLERLEATLEQEGRTRADVEVSISPPPGACDAEMARAFEQLGVDRLIIVLFAPSIDALDGVLDQAAIELIS
jgi:probable F420-dependent oxidoreductase